MVMVTRICVPTVRWGRAESEESLDAYGVCSRKTKILFQQSGRNVTLRVVLWLPHVHSGMHTLSFTCDNTHSYLSHIAIYMYVCIHTYMNIMFVK